MGIYSFTSNKTGGVQSGTTAKKKIYSFSGKTTPTLSPAASIYASEQEKNKGGILGGVGYVGEKIGLGFMQGIEGIVDYTVGGLADLFGADDFAQNMFESDWLDYNHADSWYNPSEGWKVAGDVAGGIGSSLPGIVAGTAVTLATGGAGAGALAVGLATSGLSAAGTSTKEAMRESGSLTGKEYAYGALMGGIEAGTEALSGAIGAGLGKTIKAVGTTFGKAATKATAKGIQAVTLKSVAKQAGKEFLSEAFEEGFAEFISPYAKRLTYDPNAKNATVEEIAYAAVIGGLSGVITGGGRGVITQGANNLRGNKLVSEGRAKQVISLADEMIKDDTSGGEGYISAIKEIRDRLAPVIESGKDLTGEQRRALGELNTYETATLMQGAAVRSALSAVQGADAIATKLNSDGRYKMVDNKLTYVADGAMVPNGATVREITADDITKGYDANDKSSIYKALKNNDVLRYVASADVAGRFMMATKEVEDAALSGINIKSQADLNNFIVNASAEKKAALGRELGIDDWNTLNIGAFNEKISAYRESGKAETYKQKTAKLEEMKSLAESKARSIPKAIALADGGVQRYADADSNIAIARMGNSFIVYDYATGNVTRDMTRAEVNAALAKYRESLAGTKTFSEALPVEQNAEPTEAQVEEAKKTKQQDEEFDNLANEKVKGYDKLSAANKTMIRKIFREAKATGISDADALSDARVAARTGLDITFNKEECYKGKNEAGEDVYHAGFYDPENNRIVVNPETNKKHTVLLIHELSHAMRAYRAKGGEVKYFIDEDAKVSKELWNEIKKYYADDNGKLDAELALDEASAYYAEALFGTEGAIDLLLGEKPTLKQKILSFFTKSAEYYSTDEKLSKEARRHFKKFKAMFDSFAARNQHRNAEAGVAGDTTSRRASFSSIAFSFYGVDNMTAKEFESKDYKNTEGYKAYVDECLNNMRQTQKGFDEKAARKQIEKSIDGIVSVAVAMKKAGYDIADTAEQRNAKDTQKRLLFSSLEPNSDYFTSSDISTICDKRQNFAEIYDDIVRAEESRGVPVGKRFFDNVDNYFYIHKVLADKGLTQPCRQCYVESMRKNLAPMANAFLTLVRETDGGNKSNPQLYNQSGKSKGTIKSNNAQTREEVRKILDGYGVSPDKLTVKMLTTADGLAEIKITMPELYERFNAFYGQSKPKMPKGATPFRFGELTALLTDNNGRIKQSLVNKINSTGGFRLQSYSDFQIKNYADVLQVLFEAGTLGLNGHAYTKVPAFLDATADTNLKRNISIFMYNDNGQWKIDRNDSFPYTLDEIYDVVKADKSGNTGIIAVVQNEDMAAWVMANDNIGYFIPFHKSGIKMGVVRETIVKEDGREIKGYKDIKDHTRQQTEVWATTTADHKANTKVSKPINIYEEGLWDFDNSENLPTKKLIEKNIKAYIDACEKSGYLPKFREYVMNNDKVLKNTLKYAKELGMVADTATVDDISFEYKGYKIPYGYYKCLGDFSMFKPDGTASPIRSLSLENYDFAKAVKLFSDAESVRRNEILQQFANGAEREYYRNSTMTAEELQKVIDTKRTEVVNEIVDKSARRYSFEGKAFDGKSIYKSNFPKGTPKKAKSERILKYITNVWSKEPISLVISNGEISRTIKAKFDPTIDETQNTPTDASKIAGGNRHGNSTEKRVTLDLADDYYQIVQESKYNYSKEETGKDNPAHEGVKLWHYFVDDIYFIEQENSELVPYRVTINVKEKDNGDFVYSFNAEKAEESSTQQTLHAAVNTRKGANGELFIDSIPDSEQKSNPSSENSSKNSQGSGKRASMDSDYMSAVNRGDMVTAQRMVDEAAKEAGYTYKGMHGTSVDFNNFDYSYIGDDNKLGLGFYFTNNEKLQFEYDYEISAYLKISNPIFDNNPILEDILRREEELRELGLTQEETLKAVQNEFGYDGIVAEYNRKALVVFNPEQIKSADPVTYDDDGNVIPLSERFNPKKSDIRYTSETIENVAKSRFTEPDVKLRDKIKAKFVSTKDKLYIDTVDELYGVEKYLKKYGGRNDAEAFVQQVRAAETMAQTMIGVAQYDITDESGKGKRLGDSITKIFKKYHVRNITKEFHDYLLHNLNVDRMTLHERSLEWQAELEAEFSKAQADFNRAEALVKQGKKKHIPREIRKALTAARNAYESFVVLEDKPVFGENEKRAKAITADESRKIIEEYEKEYPEFRESAEAVWAYSKNLQAMRVSSGLISQESADIMAKYYPHYVPSFRDTTKTSGAGAVKNESQLAVNSTIKRAKGGGEDIYPIEESIAVQTRQTIKAIQINRMANAVYDAAQVSKDTTYVLTEEAAEQRANTDPDDDIEVDLTPKNNQIVFYRDGKKIEMNVAEEIFAGFQGVTEGSVSKSPFVQALNKILSSFKNLVTQYSPAFAVRNVIRDIQDAVINSKHPATFAKNIPTAIKGMVENDSDWQLYLAYGGFSSTVFDAKGFSKGVGDRGFEAFQSLTGIDAKGFKKLPAALKNVLTSVGNANAFIEQMTRFAEFKASLAAGDSVQTAINNSAEVTTNFSRHGKFVKKLNANFIPFLNASVQGFDKLLRVISGPFREQSLAAITILLLKALAIGIAPQLLNMIMNGDNEDYYNLTNEVRENYFLIKAGDQFVKIPRGRAAGAIGGIVNRIGNVTRGEDFDFLGYAESLKTNVTPVDSFTRDILSPFRDVASNTTWYGGEIEGRQFDNIRPGQRYDESTSSIAIAIGGALNYSPKKIHYLMDQYLGVIGDFLLPATTAKAEKDYLSGNFLLDPKTNNKLSNDFYKLYDEAQYSKNEGNVTAYYQLKHLNDVKDSVSKLYDEITAIQKSDKKDSEKIQETRAIRVLINNLYKTAKTDYAAYTKAIESTEGLFDESTATGVKMRHTVITQRMYGSEKALSEYNADVYAKSQLFNKAGISYDTFYEYYFTTKDIEADVDKKGNKIDGSKRKKVVESINAMKISRAEKLMLIAASGYAVKDGDVRGVSAEKAKKLILNYILKMNATKEEKAELAKACGFEVKNGKIIKNPSKS